MPTLETDAVGDEEQTSFHNLGEKFGIKATSNIETWGNQRFDTLLLALIEEIGEIAHAISWECDVGDIDAYRSESNRHSDGRQLISEMAGLGIRTRSYLESEFGDPPGDGDTLDELELFDDPDSTDPILDEIEDAGPLLYQLYWAIEDLERSKGGEG